MKLLFNYLIHLIHYSPLFLVFIAIFYLHSNISRKEIYDLKTRYTCVGLTKLSNGISRYDFSVVTVCNQGTSSSKNAISWSLKLDILNLVTL